MTFINFRIPLWCLVYSLLLRHSAFYLGQQGPMHLAWSCNHNIFGKQKKKKKKLSETDRYFRSALFLISVRINPPTFHNLEPVCMGGGGKGIAESI